MRFTKAFVHCLEMTMLLLLLFQIPRESLGDKEGEEFIYSSDNKSNLEIPQGIHLELKGVGVDYEARKLLRRKRRRRRGKNKLRVQEKKASIYQINDPFGYKPLYPTPSYPHHPSSQQYHPNYYNEPSTSHATFLDPYGHLNTPPSYTNPYKKTKKPTTKPTPTAPTNGYHKRCFNNEQTCKIFDNYSTVPAPPMVDRCPASVCFCPNYKEEVVGIYPPSTPPETPEPEPIPFYVQGTANGVVCTDIPKYCREEYICLSSGTNPCMDVIENCCPGWCYSKYSETERCTGFNAVVMAPISEDGQVGGNTCSNFQNLICPDETGKMLVCDGMISNIDPGNPGWNYCQTYLPETFAALSSIPPPANPTNDADKCFSSCLSVIADNPTLDMDLSCCCGTGNSTII